MFYLNIYSLFKLVFIQFEVWSNASGPQSNQTSESSLKIHVIVVYCMYARIAHPISVQFSFE